MEIIDPSLPGLQSPAVDSTDVWTGCGPAEGRQHGEYMSVTVSPSALACTHGIGEVGQGPSLDPALGAPLTILEAPSPFH